MEGCCPARGSTLSPSPAVLSGQPRNLHLPRGGTQRGPVSHSPAAAPCPHHPVPLLAISPRSGGSCPSSCLLGNQWATHGPYLRASCGKGSLPSLSVGQLHTWGRGEPAPFLLCWGQGWGHCHCPHSLLQGDAQSSGTPLQPGGQCCYDTDRCTGVQPRPLSWAVVDCIGMLKADGGSSLTTASRTHIPHPLPNSQQQFPHQGDACRAEGGSKGQQHGKGFTAPSQV